MTSAEPAVAARGQRLVLWFDEITAGDIGLVGGKNASLGEMYNALTPRGIRIPNGFAITATAYRQLLRSSGLDARIDALLDGLDTADVTQLRERGAGIRAAFLEAELPADLRERILEAYDRLSGDDPSGVDVAVRSSATAEDLPDASFAGQQESYLNVRGRGALLDAVRRCFASLFTDRAISYRVDRGFAHADVALSIGVQRMVRSDLAASGVIFTLDTESGHREVVLVNASYGLGENVVKGVVTPDEYYVFKPTLREGKQAIVRRRLGSKELRLVYDTGGGRMTRNVPVGPSERARFAIPDEDVLQLARWAVAIEEHYSTLRGAPAPMDVEWAKDGRSGELFVVQARPETVQSRRAVGSAERFRLLEDGAVLLSGAAVGERIAAGRVRVIRDVSELPGFEQGEVLVAERTDPDWEPVMKRAAAIVTDRGGRTSHAAIVSRELGVPAVIGTESATRLLRNGQPVTVSCADGAVGHVYAGELRFEVDHVDIADLPRPRTRLLVNIGDPDQAFRTALLPADGVGLAREEFIIANQIGVHPLALLRFDELEPGATREEIARRTVGYADRGDYFVDRLAEGVATIAAAFHPRDVIVRLSDFKSNEYAGLLGGRQFEPVEANPMLGLRGASRYYHERYREAFALECRALRRVRGEMGLTNVKLMVPFCRTPAEAERVHAELARQELRRGEDGLQVYMMCELPANVELIEEFARSFDGFSIGSNDLTQFVLAVDRDSELVSGLYDERDPAVLAMLARAIEGAHAAGRPIGICGEAPSTYPEVTRFLVEHGIDSVSLNPDALLSGWQLALEVEAAGSR